MQFESLRFLRRKETGGKESLEKSPEKIVTTEEQKLRRELESVEDELRDLLRHKMNIVLQMAEETPERRQAETRDIHEKMGELERERQEIIKKLKEMEV